MTRSQIWVLLGRDASVDFSLEVFSGVKSHPKHDHGVVLMLFPCCC